MKKNIFKLLGSFLIAIVLFSCSNRDPYGITLPPELVSFSGASGVYGVPNDPNTVFKIPVGFTTVSDKDRVVSFDITSPTGAVSGTNYTILNNPLTIKAGTAADSLLVRGSYASFTSTDDIDSLIISIKGTSDVKPASFNNVYKLAMRRFCPTNIADFAGDFVVVRDAFEDTAPGDIVPLTAVSANSFSFRYKGASNPTPIVVTINTSTNAVTVARQTIGTVWSWNTSYANPSVQGTGTYEPCNKVITFAMTWGINGGSSVFNGGPFAFTIRKQ